MERSFFCDLERDKVIDLLLDRSTESLERWLRTHPGAEVISRANTSLYAEAAAKAAPHAVQVADRWHLFYQRVRFAVNWSALSDVL